MGDMASCFAGLVRFGAFWRQRYSEIRVWTCGCGAHEHQRASEADVVQCVVKGVCTLELTQVSEENHFAHVAHSNIDGIMANESTRHYYSPIGINQ